MIDHIAIHRLGCLVSASLIIQRGRGQPTGANNGVIPNLSP